MTTDLNAWMEGDTIANGIRLHYYRTGGRNGNTKPPLVIVTGVSDIGIGYSRVARALEGDYDIVMYDKRGHGASEKVATGYTFEEHAADLIDLIDSLNLEHPRVLAHSGGAAAATIAAVRHPDMMDGLILYDPCWGSGWGGWAATTQGLRGWFNRVVTLSEEELLTEGQKENPGWHAEDLTYHVAGKLNVSPAVAQTFDQPEPLWRETLPQITCPILLLTGDRDHGLISPDDVQAMSERWHNGKVVQIAGAGHMVHYDQYEPFVAAVKAFLAEI